MGRPCTKPELLDAARKEFTRLWAAVDLVPADRREASGACGAWSVKDLLAHLHAWHEMVMEWERAGSAGETPQIPGHGFTWAEIPALNQMIFERAQHDTWKDVTKRLRVSHGRLMALIESYDDDDLVAKRRFSWTGTTSVGSYFVSASSSHYSWASNLIRRFARQAGRTS